MRTAIALLLALAAAGSSRAGGASSYSHQEYFEHYEGTSTCLECHEEAAEAFFHSVHYQWLAEAPNIANAGKERLGKLNTVNDFCTNPQPNWIGNVTNDDGKVLAQGCSKCHAGLGERPSSTLSRAQLENIDCLICHASGYRRDLYQDEDSRWQWRPILWKNQVGLDSVSKRIMLPERKMCLRCHSGAGGGPNFKRGDIEYTLAECDRSFDVHMGTDGADLQCIACHAGQDHRIRGRGADLAGTDLPEKPLSCATTECHGPAPHGLQILDHHAVKVSCTVCHIPDFAKVDATDMRRDWSRPVHDAEANKYSATIIMEKDVRPVYAWWNGRTRLQKMGEPVHEDADGTVGIMIPEGRRKDKDAKLYAFKLHQGVLPVLKEERWLIPIAVEEFFADGDIDRAVHEGAATAYGIDEPAYEWIRTTRYMGIFHEVQPAERALGCLDCHREGGRLDWQALGYGQDPLLRHLK
jgi:hypothetical protein